jgi:hypothetical protein
VLSLFESCLSHIPRLPNPAQSSCSWRISGVLLLMEKILTYLSRRLNDLLRSPVESKCLLWALFLRWTSGGFSKNDIVCRYHVKNRNRAAQTFSLWLGMSSLRAGMERAWSGPYISISWEVRAIGFLARPLPTPGPRWST